MSIDCIRSVPSQPLIRAVLTPARIVYAVFLKAIGALGTLLGCRDWGQRLEKRSWQIICQTESLLTGLFAYGRRFLVAGDNSESSCRGSSYWMIYHYFHSPQIPLDQLAMAFEDGAPIEAVQMHENNTIPEDIEEKLLWEVERGVAMPALGPGVYTFVISDRKEGHRFALFKGETSYLFDPNTGLSLWEDSDWEFLIGRFPGAMNQIKCYQMKFKPTE